MSLETPLRPGPYPTLYTCRYCQAVVKKKEIIAGRATEIDESTCVCPACLPRWKEQEKRRAQQMPVAENESFVALIAAAREDRVIRDRVLAIAGLDAFNRDSMLNTILTDLKLQGAPAELLGSLSALKDDNIALRVREVLGEARDR
jgi:hypothetical protein